MQSDDVDVADVDVDLGHWCRQVEDPAMQNALVDAARRLRERAKAAYR